MIRKLTVAAIAAGFAMSLAHADDKGKSSSSSTGMSNKSSSTGAASTGGSASQGKSDGGAEAMFKALDKNNDGSLSKEEVKGTPHDKEFSKLDKNHDGKLSREEHAAAPEHQGEKASSGASSSNASTPSASSGAKSK